MSAGSPWVPSIWLTAWYTVGAQKTLNRNPWALTQDVSEFLRQTLRPSIARRQEELPLFPCPFS